MALFNLKKNIEDLQTTKTELEGSIQTLSSIDSSELDAITSLQTITNNFSLNGSDLYCNTNMKVNGRLETTGEILTTQDITAFADNTTL